MRNLLLLSLLSSTPAFEKEQYACFEAGNEDPLPKKLLIDGDLVFWWPLLKQWEVHGHTNFCNLVLRKVAIERARRVPIVSTELN